MVSVTLLLTIFLELEKEGYRRLRREGELKQQKVRDSCNKYKVMSRCDKGSDKTVLDDM